MRILVIGAGVIGSLYGAKLALAGQDVTVLARGRRLDEIRASGLVIEDARRGRREHASVAVVESLSPDDRYDLVIVAVRGNQVESILPMLRDNASPAVLFMVNNAAGPARFVESLGEERVLLGFPGAGGTCTGGVIEYTVVYPVIQFTTIGEARAGAVTERVSLLTALLRRAGFPAATCGDMDAWLKTHVALVSPIANVVYAAGGDMRAAARDRALMRTCVEAVKENLRAIVASGVPPTPGRLGLLRYVPTGLLAWVTGLLLDTDYADLVVARHANNARDEMGELARQIAEIANRAGVSTSAADELAAYI